MCVDKFAFESIKEYIGDKHYFYQAGFHIGVID